MASPLLTRQNIKKYLPGIFLAVLTITLMFYFKDNRGAFGEIVTKSKDDLFALYTKNLKPLLFGTEITNEDVFNFALYQTLPIDKKENKLLKISEVDQETYYEVIPSSYKAGTENYENFVKFMMLDANQKNKLDSILNSYRGELSEAIFTDGANTLAINSRITDLQKAVLTDIAAFAKDANKPQLSSLLGGDLVFLDSHSSYDLVEEIRKDTSRQFVIIAPDTAFTSYLEFDLAVLRRLDSLDDEWIKNDKRFPEINITMKERVPDSKLPPPPPIVTRKEFENQFGYSFKLPSQEFDNINFNRAAMDSLRNSLSAIRAELSKISFSFDIDSLRDSFNFQLRASGKELNEELFFEFNFDNINDIVTKSLESALQFEGSEQDWENFAVEIDSLVNEMVNKKADSKKLNKERIKKLEELKKRKNQ